VNAYSDFIPPSFSEQRDVLATFPSREAFAILEATQVRYVVFHLAEYTQRPALEEWLARAIADYAPYLRLLDVNADLALYEVVAYPAQVARMN
jgi:hypothetical protein